MNPRLRRLQADYDLVRSEFSGHPHVRVEPTGVSQPPESYRIVYNLRGLTLNGDTPVYREQHVVDLSLPLRYPSEKPYAVPVEPIFHPNIRDYFCIADYWAAGTTLVDIIAKMGDMIQWRIYNPASPLDAVAAKWAVEQEPTGLFPIGLVELGVADIGIELRGGTAKPASDDLPPAEVGAESTPIEVDTPAADVEIDDFEVTVKRS